MVAVEPEMGLSYLISVTLPLSRATMVTMEKGERVNNRSGEVTLRSYLSAS